jgi:hypothetical protein
LDEVDKDGDRSGLAEWEQTQAKYALTSNSLLMEGVSRVTEAACQSGELFFSSEQIKRVEILANGNQQIAS